MQEAVRQWSELTVGNGEAGDVIIDGGGVAGIKLVDGRAFGAGSVVLTTGTFLRGLIHIGEQRTPARRVGEAAAVGLSTPLERVGFYPWRPKTGTPPPPARRTHHLAH